MGLRLFRPTGLNTAPQHGYRMAIRRAFFRPISPYGAQYGLLAPPISPYGAQYGSAAPRGGAFVPGFRSAYPGRHRALSNAEPPYSIAITPTISYNDIRDQWHARRATMTEEANYGQISQSR